MRTKILFFLLLAGIPFLWAGCDKDDNGEKGIQPTEPVAKAFAERYPDAQNIVFEIEGNYYEIDFTNDGRPTTAWFTDQGQWVMDKVKYPFSQLPQAVINSFLEGSYGSWTTDDCYIIQRAGIGTVYKIEAENGGKDIDLYYAANGELIQSVDNNAADDAPVVVPQKVITLIQLTFPGAELLDIRPDANGYMLGLLDKNTYKVVQLNSQYAWQSTTWKVTQQEVPALVTEGFQASEYASGSVQRISTLLNADGTFYIFEVKQDGRTIRATFNVFGQLVPTASA